MRYSILLVFFFFLLCINAHSAYVEKIKDKKALIFLDGMTVEKGDLVYSISSNGKKVSILRITTVKDNKAIGQIVKGKARVNQEVIAKGTSAQNSNESSGQDEGASELPLRKSKKATFAFGGLLGFSLDNMEININGETIEQTGTGFSVFAALDYKIFDWLSLRGLLGVEEFSVSGEAQQPTTECQSCDTDIRYVGGVLWAKLYPVKTPINFWAGGGFGVFHPTGKETNALEKESIDTTGVYAVGAGSDINLNPDLYLPIQVEYMFLPSSADVKTNIYAIKMGLMYRF